MGRLNNRQQRFVEEYMVDFNATQAAIRAGYAVKTARQQGSANLSKPDISRAIEKRRAELSRRTGISAERVLVELGKIAFAKAPDIINDEDGRLRPGLSEADSACVQSIRVRQLPDGGVEREVRLYDKQKALDSLGKYTGVVVDRKDITTNGKAIESGVANVLVVPSVMDEAEWERLAMGGTDDNDAG